MGLWGYGLVGRRLQDNRGRNWALWLGVVLLFLLGGLFVKWAAGRNDPSRGPVPSEPSTFNPMNPP